MAKKTKNKSFDEQLKGEEIIVLTNNHPVVLRKPLIATVLILLVSAIPFSVDPFNLGWLWVFLAGFIVSGLVFFYYWIGWRFSYFAITNHRVLQVSQKGFYKRSVSEISLDKIQNVNYSVDGLQQHLLHFGTVTIQTYAGELVFSKIQHPQSFHEKLTHMIKEIKSSPPAVIGGENA